MKHYKTLIAAVLMVNVLATAVSAQTTGCISGDCDFGQGTWRWPSGALYIGEFKNGQRSGYGYYRFKNKDEYIGDWDNNRRHGYGVYIYASKGLFRKYAGEWKNNMRSGMGIMYYQNNAPAKFGIWKDNKFVTKYHSIGCQEGDCHDGYGVYVWSDGSRYEGMYKNGKRAGQGTYYYPRGAKYIGTQANGKRNGRGKYHYPNGKRYIGEWLNEKKQGKGTMYARGKVAQHGCWSSGRYVGTPQNCGGQRVNQADTEGPIVKITKPEVNSRGTEIVIQSREITVAGTATDPSGIRRVRVNGYVATLGTPGRTTKGFAAKVVFAEGQTSFWVEATDMYGNTAKRAFTLKIGGSPIVSELAQKGKEPALPIDRIFTEKRTALVIGNANYKEVPLRNPVNDARAMGNKLRTLGFDVLLHTNVNQGDMKQAIRDFGEKLERDGGVGMFYYAGHGLQTGGQNFLVPVNAKIQKPLDIELESVKLQRILNEMEFAKNRLNIVVLDACRDNPYAGVFERERSTATNGLAAPTRAPIGTFIAYSTSPGRAASDGSGQHGLYTEELLRALELAEGMKLEDVFKMVRSKVRLRSKGRQIPWENSSVEGDFYFLPGQ